MGHKEKLKCHNLFLKIYDETYHDAENRNFKKHHKQKHGQQKIKSVN